MTAHPARPANRVRGVQVRWLYLPGGELFLRWRIDGARDVMLPPYAGSGRGDDLWTTTCFELFLDFGDGTYREFNFSPSGRWAAYDFASYRSRSGEGEIGEWPETTVERGTDIITGAVRVPRDALSGATRGSLTAVVEEEGGVISFWAPAHHNDEPDFHDRTCFTLDFAPPQAT
ncbi:MAG: DOMON-like domain-containing protein [Novosphingobium sp.]|nr:DOMON-like domain-containing protein [Novosphingobium sp.]